MFKTLNVAFKGVVLLLRPGTWLGFLSHPALFFYNVLGLSRYIASVKNAPLVNDFFTWKRDHEKRYVLYKQVSELYDLKSTPVDYLEFGVASGNSMRWWIRENTHADSRFYGFDTFEGLPEDWGTAFKKGAMRADIPETGDDRVQYIKGLFQDTLPGFLRGHDLNGNRRKVIHLDADLFSSTLFTLASLSHVLRPGDIVLFDEFNVPNHEYYAFRIFEKSFYRKFRLLGAVNNFYQAAFEIEN